MDRPPKQYRVSAVPKDVWLQWLGAAPVLWAATLLALISVADALRNSMLYSLDFQWSPARLLAQHLDPWAVYLGGDPGHRILLNQVPNYLQELYVWMLPFGYLPAVSAKLIWAMLNLTMVLASCACVVRVYELPRREAWLLTVLVLTSTPFRVTLGNGQATAVVLLCLSLWAVVSSSGGRGLLLGLAWAKYSVPPVLAFFLVLRRRWRLLFFSVLPPVAGFLFFYDWLHTPFWTLVVEPLRCSTRNVSPGLANIMAVGEIALRHPPLFHTVPDAFYLAPQPGWSAAAPYVAGVLVALLTAAYLFQRGAQTDGRIHLACLTAASLLCFKHQIYDFLFLVFCLALALKARPCAMRTLLLLSIAYFWYGERLVHIRRWEFWPSVVLVSFLLLLALVWAAWSLRGTAHWIHDWDL